MSTNPTSTHTTSVKDRPRLRAGLIGLWAVLAGYTFTVLGVGGWQAGGYLLKLNFLQALLNFSVLFQLGFGFGVDLLLVIGFALVGVLLVMHRSDDWFAIFTSLFLITFGARLTDQVNLMATTPGYESFAGLVLALGDSSILLFLMLFPDGKFLHRWMKFLAPVLVAGMFAIYSFPTAPFFWRTMGTNTYFTITSILYSAGFLLVIYRYFWRATLAQKQQIRWVMLGLMGPLLWYLIFQTSQIFIPAFSGTTMLAMGFQTASHVASPFMFLVLPLSIAFSIVRTKLFDIDFIINRSLVYGALTGGLVLIFAAMLLGISALFKSFQQGDQSLLAATVFAVAAGALFQPARKRLQRFVDRVFYRIHIDYDKTPGERRTSAELYADRTTTLSSYRNLKLIGRGGMAEVYRATSPTTSTPVAIKVLPASLATDNQFRLRFLREAEIVSGLDHPNIVRVLDFGDENGAYFFVMEHLSGPDLSHRLKQEKGIALPEAVSILRDVGSALDYAHQRGLVHRDIKPSNVMMDTAVGTSRAVLTDFGIAKITDAHTRITATGVLGTFDYIAPEQIQASAEVDGGADLYALGVMTYQMLTGHLPFERPNTGALLLAHISAPPPDARELVPEIPRHAAYAIQRMMAKKPRDRYATAAEFVAALESA